MHTQDELAELDFTESEHVTLREHNVCLGCNQELDPIEDKLCLTCFNELTETD